jgi:hypothetical protein
MLDCMDGVDGRLKRKGMLVLESCWRGRPPVEAGVTSGIDGALIGDAPIVEIASGGDQMNGISRIEQNTK